MAKSKSSKGWLKEHFEDEYVKKSQQDGVRSRAVYKLQELDQKDKLIRPGMNVVDLGAAPGGWSEYVAKRLAGKGTIVATDILDMDYLDGVSFIQGDFREEEVLNSILDQLENNRLDLVLSDMAPNISGMESVDQPASIYLVELALDFALQTLNVNGRFLVKVFQGSGFEDYLAQVRDSFKKVKIRKPKASRARSKEVYILAEGLKS